MYVMSPSPHPRPSYKHCAANIVLPAPKPSFEEASCCIVDVVNGGLGLRETSFSETSDTTKPSFSFAASTAIAAASASSLHPGSIFPSLTPCTCVSSATKFSVFGEPSPAVPLVKSHFTLQYSSFENFSMSNSLSQISLNATLCTRPALSRWADGIFRHSTPDSPNPKR